MKKLWIFHTTKHPQTQLVQRGLQTAPNPYGFKPGRHYWDGVECSTGKFFSGARVFAFHIKKKKNSIRSLFV